MACGIDENVETQLDTATFPVGCTETLSFCNAFYEGEPQTCRCVGDASGAGWECGC
jgi:hypothetical protein